MSLITFVPALIGILIDLATFIGTFCAKNIDKYTDISKVYNVVIVGTIVVGKPMMDWISNIILTV